MAYHVQCTSNCSVRNADGIVIRLRAGTIYRQDDTIVKLHPNLFIGIDTGGVEQATRNPGQKRNTKRPAQ